METYGYIILTGIIIGIILVLYYFMLDPWLYIKQFLRSIKEAVRIRTSILLSPIWLPFWIIDKLFDLKIFISDLTEASKFIPINFKKYETYILIKEADLVKIGKIINSFLLQEIKEQSNSINKENFDVLFTINRNTVILKLVDINFSLFKLLIVCFDNSLGKNRIYDIKGICLTHDLTKPSFFIKRVDTSFMLQGRTNQDKKMYVSFDPNDSDKEEIAINNNINYLSKFDFEEFKQLVKGKTYKSILVGELSNLNK